MEVLKETKYLKFVLHARIPSRRTDIVEITSVHHLFTIGYIKWFAKWRQYCFFPCGETVWNNQCLEDVANIITIITRRHFEEKDRREGVKRVEKLITEHKVKNLIISSPHHCAFREVSFYERLISTDEKQISGYCCKHPKCTPSLLKKLKKDFLPCNDDKVFPKNCPLL